jgi:hypothetical protein
MAEVNFTQCAVAFLDILGFKDFIAAAEVTGSKEFEQFRQLQDVIDRQLTFTTDDPKREQHKFPEDVGLTTIHISDSFVLSAPVNNENRPDYSGLVAVAIKTIQLAHQLLDMGFLLRGGIAVGSVYRTYNNIFGTGYQDAYETESNVARTPRIVLHPSAVEQLEGGHHSGLRLGELAIFMREGEQFILDTLYTHWSYVGDERDCDLVKLFNGYKATMEHKLSTLSVERARDKWKWMAKLFNAKLRDCRDLRAVLPIELVEYPAFAFGPVIEQPQTTFREAFGSFMAPTRYVSSFRGQGGIGDEP